jgi:hypothetical protein
LESFTRLRDLLGVQSIKTINWLVSKCSLGEDMLETSCFCSNKAPVFQEPVS